MSETYLPEGVSIAKRSESGILENSFLLPTDYTPFSTEYTLILTD